MFKKCIAVSVVFHIALVLVLTGFSGRRLIIAEKTFFQIENVGPGSVQAAQTAMLQGPKPTGDSIQNNHHRLQPADNAVKIQDVVAYRRPEPEPIPTTSIQTDQDTKTASPLNPKQKTTENQAVETISTKASPDLESKNEVIAANNSGKPLDAGGSEPVGNGEGKKFPGNNADTHSDSVSNAGSGNGAGTGNGCVAKTTPGNPNANPVQDPKLKEVSVQVPVRPYPVPVYLPKPEYPLLAQKKNWQGIVKLQATVKPDGTVGEIVIIRSSGHNVLDQEAIRIFKTWLFSPALKGGVPVSGLFEKPFDFHFTPGGKS